MSDGTQVKSIFDHATDQDLEREGVWIEDILPGVEIKVRSFYCQQSSSWNRRRANKQKMKIKAAGGLSEEEELKNRVDLMAEVLVADWRGPQMVFPKGHENAGQPIPCDIDHRRSVLREHRPLRDGVMVVSMSDTYFHYAVDQEGLEETEGN